MIKSVVMPMYERLGLYPYCGVKLGAFDNLKQKLHKSFRYRKCGKRFDVWHIVY